MDELKEFRELVTSIKEDRQQQKKKEASEAWTKHVSLSMIFLAVLAAAANQKGGGFSSAVMKKLNEATFDQAAASDQWSYYEAKSIKETLAENQIDALNASGKADPARLAALTANAKRYDAEKKAIMKEASACEAKRDAAMKTVGIASILGGKIGLASTLFQVAIAIGGVCLIVKRRPLWWVSLGLGAIAAVQMARVLMM